MNHYPHHIGDYDSDTAHLEWAEDMAYTRLLRLYYRTERPIPTDVAEACRLIRAKSKDERKAVETVLREFFTPQDDGWHNKRADAEIYRYQEKAKRNREVGKKGGRPATQKEPTNNPDGFQNETQTITQTEPEHNPNQNQNQNQNQKKEKSASQGSRLPADWTLPEEWKAVALAYRREWTSENVDFVAEKFRDYWHSVPGQKGRKADWLATWRNWCRDEKSVRGTQPAAVAIQVDL